MSFINNFDKGGLLFLKNGVVICTDSLTNTG